MDCTLFTVLFRQDTLQRLAFHEFYPEQNTCNHSAEK